MITNLPNPDTTDAIEIKNFFDSTYTKEITFPSNQIDAVVGFFLKRGFDEQAAKSTAIVLLNQARIDNINVFQVLDKMKMLNDVQLTQIVTEVMNANRDRSSTIGYKNINTQETLESRNIRV